MLPSLSYSCFYTGLPLLRLNESMTRNSQPLAYSTEHLLSKTMIRKRKLLVDNNTVPASALVNSIVGNAPLKVKYALKAHFAGLRPPSLQVEYLIPFLKVEAMGFLSRYKIHKRYPWEWSNKGLTKKHRKEVYNALLALLSDEEKEYTLYKKM